MDDMEWIESRRPSLLLVDDDTFQLSFLSKMFRSVGFEVTPTESGNAAIAQLAHSTFDAILCDWLMPDGSGLDVYQWMQAEAPQLIERCIFMSGMAMDNMEEEAPNARTFAKGQDSAALVSALIAAARGAAG